MPFICWAIPRENESSTTDAAREKTPCAWRGGGADVIGIDISADLLQIARKRVEANGVSAKFVVASAYATCLPSESVDAVFAIAILHHLDLQLAKREICRILKPGGIMVLQEPIRDSATLGFLRKLLPYRSPDVSPFERPLTTSELTSFAEGFLISGAEIHGLPLTSVSARSRTYRPVIDPKAHELFRRIINESTCPPTEC